MRTITESQTKIFDGEAFVCCGHVVLMTDRSFFRLEDHEFLGLVVQTLRAAGCREPTRRDATLEVEVTAEEHIATNHIPEGFNYLAHVDRSVKYEVRAIRVRKHGEWINAGRAVCDELAMAEHLREEF